MEDCFIMSANSSKSKSKSRSAARPVEVAAANDEGKMGRKDYDK